MSTPNPALVAAAPALISAITDVQALVATVLTGDPLQIPIRVDAAVKILAGNLELLFPELANAEEGVVETTAVNALGNLKTKLQAIAPPTA